MNMELANGVVQLGKARGLMVATAESCTGGLIAATLTDMPGSSAVVDRGFVTYSNEAKSELLGVSMATIQAQGAVSEIVARDMVSGALAASRADVAVAVTGIAGPDGGTVEKPVGLVFIAVQSRDGSPKVREYRFATSHDAHSRVEIRLAAVEAALVMMRDEMGQV